jgi:hypothetical protein
LKTNEEGFYIPSTDKASFFREVKGKFSIAYGKHSSKYPMLFLIEPNVFQALIGNPSDIMFSICNKSCEGRD